MRRFAAAAVALLALAGCTGIPTSGGVQSVADDQGPGGSTVRYSPARPISGSTPQEVVRGYLDAMLAYPTSAGTAEEFLTPGAAEKWRSFAGVRVYSVPRVGEPVSIRPSGDASPESDAEAVEVRLDVTEEAALDRQGRYAAGRGDLAMTFRLERVDGEWRVANPQPGLLVSRKFFADYYRPFVLPFFDVPGRRLVPDPVYLAVGEQLATSLVTSLARGPRQGDEDTMRTYVPGAAALRPSVPVNEDGLAEVVFSDDLGGLDENAQDRLSAQIVWALRQVPGLRAIRLVGGSSVVAPDGRSTQSVDAWAGFGPSSARGSAFAVVNGSVVEFDGDEYAPVSGAWGDDARGAVALAVGEKRIAAVLPGRERVRLTASDGSGARAVAGTGFLAPEFDGDGHLWLVDRRGSRARVRIVEGGAEPRVVAAPGVAPLGVTSFAISPDGGRYAVTAGDGVFVGRVLRDVSDRITGLGDPASVRTGVAGAADVSWTSGTEVAYLAPGEVGAQVYTTLIDGSDTTGGSAGGAPLLPAIEPTALAVGRGPAADRYATGRDGRVWYLARGATWRVLEAEGASALTFGG